MNQATKTILISGATGLVGRALCHELEKKGHIVKRLSRSRDAEVHWDLDAGTIDTDAMKDVDVVVHLAGETVAQRWSKAVKARILNSRVEGAKLLVDAILKQDNPPDYISASGINYYGDQCGVGPTEQSPKGDGFLADVCDQWEGAAQPLIDVGIRTAFMRIGLVLSSQGGALKRMLTPFKLGLGGRICSGKQRMSWIGLPDLVRIFCLAIEDITIKGPVNAVSPQFEPNEVFVNRLGELLKRPTVLPMPGGMVKLLFGEMGKETLCSDLGIVPLLLKNKGFEWEYNNLKTCLEACIKGEF
jgi:uncharacterized protein (TIGR01777 family)